MNIRQKKKTVKRKVAQRKRMTKTEYYWMEKYYSKLHAAVYKMTFEISIAVGKCLSGIKQAAEAFKQLGITVNNSSSNRRHKNANKKLHNKD